MTRQDPIDDRVTAKWSFGLLLAVVVALAVFFFYVTLPLIAPLD